MCFYQQMQMATMLKSLFVFPMIGLWCTFSLATESRLEIVFLDTQSEEAHYASAFEANSSLQIFQELIQETVPLNDSIKVIIGAEDGPLYDPTLNEIWIPNAFLHEIAQRFVDAELVSTQEEKFNVVLDVLMHTLIHEIAHAVIAQFNVPTLGKEEDAADNLANVLLLDNLVHGDDIVLNAADMFALEDADIERFDRSDFWDEHSLDLQRYYTSLCHVYGSRPEDNENLVNHGELSSERAERCIDEYEIISADWLHVLSELSEQ